MQCVQGSPPPLASQQKRGETMPQRGTRQGFGRTKARKTKNRTNTKQSAVGRRREREKEERVEAKSDGPELPAF